MPQELLLAEIIGIVAFALSGLFVATRQKLDLLGIFIISFLTALGGGVTRDIIIQKTPYSFSHFLPVGLVLGVVVIGLALRLHQKSTIESHFLFIISDTLGLVSFAITGALLGIANDFHIIGVLLLSLVTAVGGGVLRDMLLNEVPLILKSDFYGSVALLVATILYLLHLIEAVNTITIFAVFGCGIALRLIAHYKKWHLPKL